jgi:putative ABC transport system permease protein
MITKLAWKNIWFKPLNTILSLVLLTSSVAISTVLISVEKQFEEKFTSSIENVDLVLGAQGSPLQLILSAVYQVDTPTGNINFDEAKTWMNHPFVEQAIPLAFGDNYKGYKILGTTPAYLDKYGAKVKEGKLFSKNFEVVIGSELAKNLKLEIGATFYGAHGDAAEGEVHENFSYKVVGIATETGKIVDNLILCAIPSVWQMHNHEVELTENQLVESEEIAYHNHDLTIDEPNMEITAVLLKIRNQMAKLTWQRLIPQNTKMQAVSPAFEINRLFGLFGIGFNALKYLAFGIMVVSGISIFIALFSTLKERKTEFALLRVNGAKRMQLLKIVIIESMLLCCVGFLFGTILGRMVLVLLSKSTEADFKMAFNPYEFLWKKEGFLFILTVFVGVLAALIPAIKAYYLNISKTLANA